ncbi:unnamed protein product [Symbiodinium sp. CCMP2592]|nr:unnamed protein product [Symbiodinium sp. CCMP2592]
MEPMALVPVHGPNKIPRRALWWKQQDVHEKQIYDLAMEHGAGLSRTTNLSLSTGRTALIDALLQVLWMVPTLLISATLFILIGWTEYCIACDISRALFGAYKRRQMSSSSSTWQALGLQLLPLLILLACLSIMISRCGLAIALQVRPPLHPDTRNISCPKHVLQGRLIWLSAWRAVCSTDTHHLLEQWAHSIQVWIPRGPEGHISSASGMPASPDDFSSGEDGPPTPAPTTPGGTPLPAGPPPPRPVTDLRSMSHRISGAIIQTFSEVGIPLHQVLTHLPWTYGELRSARVEVSFLTPAQAFHPNTLLANEDGIAAEEEEEEVEADNDGTEASSSRPTPATAVDEAIDTVLSNDLIQNVAGYLKASLFLFGCHLANATGLLLPVLHQDPDRAARVPSPGAVTLATYFDYIRAKPPGGDSHSFPHHSGGLHDTLYHEVIAWLQAEAEAHRRVDICFLQETAWPADLEYTTKFTNKGAVNWHVVHSAGGEKSDKSGIMCLVRAGLVNADQIRTAALIPGRALHLRLLLATPLDCLCLYQHSWNLQKASLKGNKQEALLKLRRRVWELLDRWLRATPQRHGCIVAGDLNQSLCEDPPTCGPGCLQSKEPHPDQGELIDILRAHRCCVLNTWSQPSVSARTFLPPRAADDRLGTQIDFVISRGPLVDSIAKQARPVQAPFVPVSGCRHRPVTASLPHPRTPLPAPNKDRLHPRQVRDNLHDPDFAQLLRTHVVAGLQESDVETSVDAQLLAGWKAATLAIAQVKGGTASQAGPVVDFEGPLTQHVKLLWQLRTGLQRLGQDMGQWRRAGTPFRLFFQAWRLSSQMQQHARQLRKACRLRKTAKVAAVVQDANIHQAAKQFAPKVPRRRLQLRRPDGSLQTQEEEFQQIVDHFEQLYMGPPCSSQPRLSQDLNITTEEIQQALQRLRPGKVLPSSSAPAALWKFFSSEVVGVLHMQFEAHLSAGQASLPLQWNLSELVLLPKVGKTLRSPAHLRPICLLPLQAKVLAAVLAGRLQPFAVDFLKEVPQFAYVPHRTLQQALDRVLSHCAAVRTLIAQNQNDPHARRQGKTGLRVCGGLQLSLDITGAYDYVPRRDLEAALRAAAVPDHLIQAVLLIHAEARLQVHHGSQTKRISLNRGLRQGCGLAPILWALYSAWVLKQLHDPELLDIARTGTVYADDKHFSWLIRSGRDVEKAYAAVRYVLTSLHRRGLCVSMEKTVVLFTLHGPLASKTMDRYVVTLKDGPHHKLSIDGSSVYIKVVPKHVYLGAVISYRRPERETYDHRLRLARASLSRLGIILRNRSVPQRLRLQLWQGCIWPALLHGLDCTGLPLSEMQALQTQLIVQARSIVRSYSMFTREANVDLIKRLKLPSPVQRLQQAFTRRMELDAHLGPSLQLTEEQRQWRHLVRGQLFATMANLWQPQCLEPSPEAKARVVCVEKVLHETFECEICGQQFVSQASLGHHQYSKHFDAEQQEARDVERVQARKASPMEHALDGMPQCRHCRYQFTTWPAFFYHVNSRSCEFLRAIYSQDCPEATVLPLLNESLVASETLLSLAKDSDWKVLAQAEIVRSKHNHCLECHHWCVRPQYVRRHMQKQHPERASLIQKCIQEITQSNIGIQNPCQYCGQSFTRKADHPGPLANMFFREEGEGPLPMELQDLKEATKELHMIQKMVGGLEDPFALSDQHEDDRPQKWQPQHLQESPNDGKGGKGGKGQKGGTRSYRPWPNKQGQRPQKGALQAPNPQGPQEPQISQKKLEELQAVVSLLTTIVLRQEVQLNIFRQDTAYVMFLQAQGPGNLAQSLYAVGSGWHHTKEQSPEQLTSPMRVVLLQHVLERVAKGFEEMMATPSSRSKAIETEWLSKDESLIQAMGWSPTENRHVVDTKADAQTPSTIRQALQELLILSSQDFVVTRFHGMRKLAEEYKAPILGMFLEVGNRVEAAQKAWRALHLLAQSAALLAAGCYLRHERMQLRALSKRLAALTR